jgi:plastocyanin
MNTRIGGLVLVLVALIALLVLISLFAQPGARAPQAPTSASQLPSAPPPLPTAAQSAEAAQSFEFVISYTDKGFEPLSATVQVGDTVRFTNNSSSEVWVAASSTAEDPAYPGNSGCGGSGFDSCAPIEPGQFWDFTFTQSGAWMYQNNLNKNNTGVIDVIAHD